MILYEAREWFRSSHHEKAAFWEKELARSLMVGCQKIYSSKKEWKKRNG